MFTKILSFFIAVITFIPGILGFDITEIKNDLYLDVAYGTHERNKLDLCIPKYTDEAGLILFIHGGAWVAGDKEAYRKDMKSFANKYGCVCASVNYRYISETVDINDIMDDIELAVACIRTRCGEKGVRVEKMLLTGASAGGHLALLYGYSRADTSAVKPAAVFANCGPTDFTDESFYIDNAIGDSEFMATLFSWACGQTFTYENRSEAREALQKISPVYYVNETTVPTVINHGMKDNIVPFSNAQSLNAKLDEYGIVHVFNAFPNSGHGLSDDDYNEKLSDKLADCFIREYLAV